MKRSKFKFFAVAAACFCVIGILAAGFMSYADSTVYRPMTKAETERCDQITVSIYRSGTISAGDLDWMLEMLQTPSWTGEAEQTQMRHLEVMVAFKKLRSFAPGQKEQLYEATSGYLSHNNRYEPVGAMAVMRAIKDKRAVPAVTVLLNSSSDFTRKMAQKTLEVLKTS